jgi:hypothetical protein
VRSATESQSSAISGCKGCGTELAPLRTRTYFKVQLANEIAPITTGVMPWSGPPPSSLRSASGSRSTAICQRSSDRAVFVRSWDASSPLCSARQLAVASRNGTAGARTVSWRGLEIIGCGPGPRPVLPSAPMAPPGFCSMLHRISLSKYGNARRYSPSSARAVARSNQWCSLAPRLIRWPGY